MLRGGTVTAVGAATAIVVGLVVITPAAGFVGPIAAIAMGAIGAVPSYFALIYRAKTKLDDSLDVVAAHGLGGATGAILTGVFATSAWSGGPNGLLGGHPAQVLTQVASVLIVLLYSGTATFGILKLLALVMPLRVAVRDEKLGLDVSDHGEEAYTHGDGAILVKPRERAIAMSAGDAIAVESGGGAIVKLIVAVIRPEQLSDVLEALFHADVRGLTISRVQGHGGEMEHVENYRGTSVKMALAEKVRLEIGVSNHFVQPTIDAIIAAARTGEVGDGKIMVMPIEKIVRIRTGEEDQDAVTPVQAGRSVAEHLTFAYIFSIDRLRFSYMSAFSLIGSQLRNTAWIPVTSRASIAPRMSTTRVASVLSRTSRARARIR